MYKKLILKSIFLLLLLLLVFGGISFYIKYSYKNIVLTRIDKEKESVVCTMEAKMCPDGSSVSRISPTCEFATCPNIKKIEKSDEVPGIISKSEVDGWSDFINSDFGISFSYPSIYSLKNNERYDFGVSLWDQYTSYITVSIDTLESFNESNITDYSCMLNKETILSELTKLEKNFENYNEDLNSEDRGYQEFLNIKKIRIDNVPALDVREANVLAGGCIFRRIYFKKNNNLYSMAVDGYYFDDIDSAELKNNFEILIKSFNFID